MALFELGLSEKKFLAKFDQWERAQMLATYQAATNDIPWLQQEFPIAPRE